ncbi:hypothetical protein FPQ18DRAFT_420986 [Pyronema domesticum]|nr:hypothetical protein FPQ18DRAFT_420986 [Pyronema domesticum]
MQGITLEEWEKLGDIMEHTNQSLKIMKSKPAITTGAKRFQPNPLPHLMLSSSGYNIFAMKTHDVLNVLYEYENQRPVFWIYTGSVTQFEADYRKLGSLAKIPGHDDTKQNIGLILNNGWKAPRAENGYLLLMTVTTSWISIRNPRVPTRKFKESDIVSIAQYGIAKFIPRGSKGKIIVTTRDREFAKHLANQNILIKPELSREQAIELFYQYYSNAYTSDDTTDLPGS